METSLEHAEQRQQGKCISSRHSTEK